MSPFHIRTAIQVLSAGGIISYPTDTIPGLGTLPIDEQILMQLIRLKRRKSNKGLILLGSAINQFSHLVEADELKQLQRHLDQLQIEQDNQKAMPRNPTTYLVQVHPDLAKKLAGILMGQYQKLAIRITTNEAIHQICSALNQPLVSTSLNLSNRKTLLRNFQAHKFFPRLDYYLSIEPTKASPSRIIDFQTGKILR